MKTARPFFVFLLFVIVSTLALSFMLPTRQRLEKSISINAPASVVFEQVAKLSEFNQWSVWSLGDSSAVYTYQGTDGTLGASSSWKGHPLLSGEGKLEITAIEPGSSVTQSLELTDPKKVSAISRFTVVEQNGISRVTWNFSLATPRPWNIFNLFADLNKEKGADFEKSLQALKERVEKRTGNTTGKTYEVQPMDFPATRFAMVRQQVKWADISVFFKSHLDILYKETARQQIAAGAPAGLYFVWDEKNQQTDMGAALTVPAGSTIQGTIFRTEDIPASKAIYVTYAGPYDRIADAHNSLDQYLANKKLQQKTPVIEQYISGPNNEKDSSKWITKILYLVD
jgi:effector-binding domain-containing protein